MRQTIRAISSRSAITTPATTPLFPPPLDFESSPAHVYTRATTPTYYTVKIEKLSYIYRWLSYLNAPMGVTSTTIPCTHNLIGTPCLPATCVQQRAQQRVSIGGTNRLCQLPPTLLQTFLFLPPGPVHTQAVLQKQAKDLLPPINTQCRPPSVLIRQLEVHTHMNVGGSQRYTHTDLKHQSLRLSPSLNIILSVLVLSTHTDMILTLWGKPILYQVTCLGQHGQ